MGQRGRREKVSLYFSTSCLFSCFRIDCQRWYEMHVGGLFDLVWVRVAYLVWKFGLRGLWVRSHATPRTTPSCPLTRLFRYERFGSSDLLDSGGWAPRSLQAHHQWCAGGQRAHPWDHNDVPCGHSHKSCNQQPTHRSTQMSKPNMRLAPRLNRTNHQRAFHTTFDNQYGHKKTNTKYRNTN